MRTQLFEKTAKMEEVLLDKRQYTVLHLRTLISPNFDVPHATTGFIEIGRNLN